MNLTYPRTLHLEGSKGVVEDSQVSLAELNGPFVTIEEKLDGSQVAICFEDGVLNLTTRSGPLPKTEAFGYFQVWANTKFSTLYEVLSDRYILWGEWLQAKHSIFYDALPHHFMEYDIFDLEESTWLSTPRRHKLLEGTGIHSVPVIERCPVEDVGELEDWVQQQSLYRTEFNEEGLKALCKERGCDFEQVALETDLEKPFLPEGLFIKSETDKATVGWYKYIRKGFLDVIQRSGSHWRDRPFLPNTASL